MKIRLEKTEDYREVENLTREAFWNVYRPGCTEHYVLNQYRNNPDFIHELDFVMEEDNKIIGHVMFSTCLWGGYTPGFLRNSCPPSARSRHVGYNPFFLALRASPRSCC